MSRVGNVGEFPIDIRNCCYCLLHAVLRITEKLLKCHVESLSVKTDDKQAKQEANVVRVLLIFVKHSCIFLFDL